MKCQWLADEAEVAVFSMSNKYLSASIQGILLGKT